MSAYKIFNKTFTHKSLKSIYSEHISDTSAVGLDKISRESFEKNLGEEVHIIKRKCLNSTYKFTPYKQKLISKGANSFPRVISIPTFRDRLTLRAICELLSKLYCDDLKLDIPQVKVAEIKKEIKKNSYSRFIKIDISGYYPSIEHQTLMSKLSKKIRKKEILSLIEKALKNPTLVKTNKLDNEKNLLGVPQGLSISNILAEIYLYELDRHFSNIEGVFYTRYVDDILIFCKKSHLKNLKLITSSKLEALGLSIHPFDEDNSKSYSDNLRNEFDYLGYRFSNRKTSIKKHNIQKLESSLASIFTTYKHKASKAKNEIEQNRALRILEWRLNLRITGCIYENTKKGWIFYFSQLDDLAILYGLDSTVKKLIRRFELQEKINQKKFSKTFFEAQRVDKESHKYIINFDCFSETDKRSFLEIYLGPNRLSNKSSKDIDRMFNMKISTIIEELEQDLENFS